MNSMQAVGVFFVDAIEEFAKGSRVDETDPETRSEFRRVHAIGGWDNEAGIDTPEELALALVSEIQAVFAEASAESLRDRKTPIHGWNVVRRPVKECATSAP